MKKTLINKIHPNPDNPREISPEDLEKLKNSLERLPKLFDVRPIIVNQDGMILGGNMRYKAAKALGWKTVPVETVDWTEEEQKEAIILDNVASGSWLTDLLLETYDKELLLDLGMDPMDLELEMDLPEEEDDKEPEEDDYTPPPEIDTKIQEGDLYQIGPHFLKVGDALEDEDLKDLIRDHKVDVIFTDPPYALQGNSTGVEGVTDDKMVRPFFLELFKRIQRTLKPFGHVYVCCDWHSATVLNSQAIKGGMVPKNLIVWDKGDGGVGAMFQNCHELIWFMTNSIHAKKRTLHAVTGERTVNGVSNIWREKREGKNRQHNAQKPVALPHKAITLSSDRGEVVMDLFLGSGTTMIAAHQTGRICLGMEIDPKWAQVTMNRMKAFNENIEIKKLN